MATQLESWSKLEPEPKTPRSHVFFLAYPVHLLSSSGGHLTEARGQVPHFPGHTAGAHSIPDSKLVLTFCSDLAAFTEMQTQP